MLVLETSREKVLPTAEDFSVFSGFKASHFTSCLLWSKNLADADQRSGMHRVLPGH
jgi:hypothetical protein